MCEGRKEKDEIFSLVKWANPGLFYCLLLVYCDKQLQILEQFNVKTSPSSIQIRTQSPLITTTPQGLPAKQIELQTQKERL